MRQPGFALVLVILMSMLLSMMAIGMVAVGTREVVIAGAAARRAQARATAEAGARLLFHGWSTRALSDLELGEGRPFHVSSGTAARVERVDSTLYLIRTRARVPSTGPAAAIARAGLLARTFDPERTARAFPASATVEGPATVTEGLIDGRDLCGSGRHAPGLFARSLVAGTEARIHGSPDVVLEETTPLAPDPLTLPLVAAIATIRPGSGTVSPRPVAQGESCVEDGRNWGAPEPEHVCHPLLPLVFAPHDLIISGGQARAVIVVDGDLRLMGETRITGLVLVDGELTVEQGASIRGAARAHALFLRGGELLWDACVADAARSAPALDRAYRPSTRWWIPAF